MIDTAARAPRPATREQRLLAEQVKLLYANLPIALFGGLANAIILSVIQVSVIRPAIATGWLSTILLVTVGRYLLGRRYERQEVHPQDAAWWRSAFAISAGLSGAVWGSAGVLLFPPDLAHQMFIVFVLAGMAAGVVASFSAILRVTVAFLVPLLVPITALLFMDGREIYLAMALMSSLFTALMLILARRMYQTTLASLELRFENTDLVTTLAMGKEATERLNVELKREIQERMRVEEGLRQSENRIRAVVDNVLDGILIINDRGILESANPAVERIFGYRADEMTGRHFKMLMPDAEREEYDDYIKRHLPVGKGKMVGFGLEIAGQRKDGSIFPMELGMSEMWHDRGRLFIGIVRDITERKKVERLKSQFIATVSHELRTPLTSVLGSLSLLHEGVGGDLSPNGKFLLDIARNNIERLVRLIGDIIAIDDIQSGKMGLDLQPTDLAGLVESAVEANRALAAERNVDLRVEIAWTNAMVYADQERIAQVLDHLLSNAIKFSPVNGPVEIKLDRSQGYMRVLVSDHGPGISPDFQARVFQTFAHAQPSGARSGAGLGLSIAKAIIDKHGGTIGFDTDRDKGACFYFDLPEWQDEPSANVG